MEGHCSTGQTPQWAVVPIEEEEEEGQCLPKRTLKYSQQYPLDGRESPVYTVTRLRTKQPRDQVSIPDGQRWIFLFSKEPRLALRPTKPPIQWVLGTNSSPLNLTTYLTATIEVTNERIYTSTPHIHIFISCTRIHLNFYTRISTVRLWQHSEPSFPFYEPNLHPAMSILFTSVTITPW